MRPPDQQQKPRSVSHPTRKHLVLAVSMGLMMTPGLAPAAVFNVTSGSDSGPGTLRQAVLDANAAPGDDEITFDAGLGFIALTSGQIEYTETITITGPPGGLIISGEDGSRIFARPRAAPGRADLTLKNLILTNGFNDQTFGTNCAADEGDGGAICTRDGNVTLIKSVIANSVTTQDTSRGGAIFSYGTVTLVDSIVTGNATRGARSHGGGIRSSQVTLDNSLLLDNVAEGFEARGGGFDATTATLTGSTVSGNLVSGIRGTGAGFEVQNLTMTQSTVSGNDAIGTNASGGAFALDGSGTVTLNNSTITANTSATGAGGIQGRNGSPTIDLVSTILSGNSGPGGNFDSPGILSASQSLLGDPSGEITGISSQNRFDTDPELLPLADNGCAVEAGIALSSQCLPTHDMRAGSPAIDAGANPLNLTTDQRGAGFARVIASGIDIGAFETTAPAELLVTNANDSGSGSLREMIGLANAFSGVQTVRFDPGLPPIVLASGSIEITEGVIIEGPDNGQVIDGNNASRIFGVSTPGAPLDLIRLALINGATTTESNFTAPECTTATGAGGAVCSLGPLRLERVTIADSRTEGDSAHGGGVVAAQGLTMSDSVISSNRTAGTSAYGGGAFVIGDLVAYNSAIQGNGTEGTNGMGAGAWIEGVLRLTASTISGNSTSSSGARGGGLYIGAAFNSEPTSTIDNSTISDNSSASFGGGIYQIGGNLTIRNSTITGNSALSGGGGIEFDDGQAGVDNDYTIELESVILSGNTGPGGNLQPQDDSGSTLTFNAAFSLFGDLPDELDSASSVVFDDLPQLLPLDDNDCFRSAGAPGREICTPTRLPTASSPAFNTGSNPIPVIVDQRGNGFPRTIGPATDIGAVEIDPGLLFRDGFEP